MKKYCGYCGTRIKIADYNTLRTTFQSDIAIVPLNKSNYFFCVLINSGIWFVFFGTKEGKVGFGKVSLTPANFLEARLYEQIVPNPRNAKGREIIANMSQLDLGKEGTLNLKEDNALIAARYVIYIQGILNINLTSVLDIPYGSINQLVELVKDRIAGIESYEESSQSGKSQNRKKRSPEEQWENMLKRFKLWESLQKNKIIYLTPPPIGNTAGGSAQIINALKNEYGIISLMAKFKKDSPPRAEAGERDYYDAALYEPSIVTRSKIMDRDLVKAEEITTLKINDKTYTLGLIHALG